jgi:phosphoribosylglycinamide formyltransferase-1
MGDATAPVIGVLASGRGSNLQSLIDACEAGRCPARIGLVASDKRDAYALERARRHGIEAIFLDPRDSDSREAYDQRLAETLRGRGVGLVCLAGFMRIVTPALIRAFPGRIMNIHPSLLPAFPGLHVQRRALEHGARFSGATVHFVDEGVDTGPIIIQAAVPIREGDTEETLSARILEQEHLIYPEAVRLFSEGRLRLDGRRVLVDGHQPADGVLFNPPLGR